MNDKTLISVVSPVYGCDTVLEHLVSAVESAFAASSNLEWELILVDDRGPVEAWPIICSLAEKDKRVRGVRLSRNHGQHLAIWAGLGVSSGEYVAVIDCDLQDDPAIIPKLYAKAISEKLDAVVVERGVWSDSTWRRKASSLMRKTMKTLTRINMGGDFGNFGLYSKRLKDVLLTYKDKEVFLPFMVAMSGFERGFFTHDRSERFSGKSSYNLYRLIRMAIGIVVRFSDRPLKISILLGFVISSFTAIFSIFLFITAMMGIYEVAGWVSTVLSIWFLSGLILATLGIHGLYIGRIFSEVQNRPNIIIQDTTPIEYK